MENCQENPSPPDISAGQLDFVALLSSVGEDVIGSDLNCPEYEISTELSDTSITNESCGSLNNSDILATSLSSSLNSFPDQGMLQLVEVESEGGPAVQVVQMDEYLGVSSNTVLLQSYSTTDTSLTSNQGFLTLNTTQSLVQSTNAQDSGSFPIPDTVENIIKLDTPGSLISEGPITLDTSAISAISAGQPVRKRNLSSYDPVCVPSKQRFRSMSSSNMPGCDARELVGVVPSNIFGGSSQGSVTVQYSQDLGDSQSQNQLSGAPSTINLQDLE